jgi:hypothetical protein
VPTREYAAPEWNLALDYPAEWSVMLQDHPEPPSYVVVGLVGPKAEGPRSSLLLLTRLGRDTGEGLSAFSSAATAQLRGMFTEFQLIRQQEGVYHGVPCAVLDYSYETDNGRVQELNMTAFFGDRVNLALQFVANADASVADRERAIQLTVVNSLRIGRRGLRVPYLELTGSAASRCAACGCALSRPNALFDGRKPIACYCDRCWRST